MRRRSSLIAGVPGDACQGRNTSSSSSSGGNAKEEDLRNLVVATPTQLKRASNVGQGGVKTFGLITNGMPIKRATTSSISKPRSRRSSIDSPRLITTPGRTTPRSRRGSLLSPKSSLILPDNKLEKRKLSLSLLLEKPFNDKENNAVYALISPLQQINKKNYSEMKSNLMSSQLHETADQSSMCKSNETGQEKHVSSIFSEINSPITAITPPTRNQTPSIYQLSG